MAGTTRCVTNKQLKMVVSHKNTLGISPKVLFCFSLIDKNPSKYLLLRLSQDNHSSSCSVSPKQVLPFAFPSHSPPQSFDELVGAAGLGRGRAWSDGCSADTKAGPLTVSVPLPPLRGSPRRPVPRDCGQWEAKDHATAWHPTHLCRASEIWAGPFQRGPSKSTERSLTAQAQA